MGGRQIVTPPHIDFYHYNIHNMTESIKVLNSRTNLKVSFGGDKLYLHNLSLDSLQSLGNVVNILYSGMSGMSGKEQTDQQSIAFGLNFISRLFLEMKQEDILTIVCDALKKDVDFVKENWTNKEGMKVLSEVLKQEDVQEIFLGLIEGVMGMDVKEAMKKNKA